MAIEKIKSGKTLGATLFNKVTAVKVNEVIDAVNNITDGTYSIDNLTVETLDATTSVSTDTISEHTAATGVTIDGVLVKDSTIALSDGTVSDLSVKLGADKNNGIYGVSDTQLGIAVEGALVGGANTTGLFTSNIDEQIGGVGVTVDGMLIKDGGASANGYIAGFYSTGAPQVLSGPGAINNTSYHTEFTSTGTGDALTLAASVQPGAIKKITYVAEGAGADTGVITLPGYTSITLNAIGDYIILICDGTSWFVLENVGCTVV